MSTLLRPSSRQLARHALCAAQITSRIGVRGARIPRIAPPSSSSSSSSAYLLPRRRFYSTDPKPPRKDQDDKELEKKSKDAKTDDAQAKGEPERPKLPEGWVWLEPEELKVFEQLLTTGPAKFMIVDTLDFLRVVKKIGAPVELRDMIRKHATTGLSIADAMKAFSIAKDVAERAVSTDAQDMFHYNAPKLNSDQQKREQPKTEESEPQGPEQQPKQDGKKKDQKGNNSQNVKVLDVTDLLGWVVAAAIAFPLFNMVFPSESHEISWSELRTNYLDRGLVKKLVVMNSASRSLVRVELNQEAVRSVYPDSPVANNPYARIYVSVGSADTFERHLDEAQDDLQIPPNERIPVTYEAGSQMGNLLLAFGPTLLLVGLIFYAQRRGPGGGGAGGGMFGFGKSRAKMYNHESAVKVKFSDVAGMDEAKVEIMEFVSFLKTPERFQKLGAKIPRGAILSGPPGTGKTLLAKATAGESQVPFFSVSGSEFVEMFVGVGASRVRDLFAQARKNAPCIVFIDEIDAIGRSRSDGNRGFGGNEEREATLNQILTEMDGFNTQEQIVVLAGTNRPDVLDKALMRPGRFDRQIYIDRPTMKGRVDIFKVHLQRIVTKEEIDHLCGRLSALTPGFSGADIANAVNEAALVGKSFPILHLCTALCY